MLTLAYPWLLVLVALPLLLQKVLRPHSERRMAVMVPSLDTLMRLTGRQADRGAAVLEKPRVHRVLVWTAWILLVSGFARPQWIGEPIEKIVPTRDLLLAVDLSGSMATVDFVDAQGKQVDRLTAVKEVLEEFLSRRQGDRVGLIFFGSAAFVQAPFTSDLDVCKQLLAEAQVGMAGPRTVLGDATGLAITMFDRSEVEDRVMIMLTDGNDTDSRVPPTEAAEIARDRGITIYTVAVGDPTAAGQDALDVETLRAMAETTGGGFSHAVDRSELEAIYSRLDKLETRPAEVLSHRPRSDLFHWPLGLLLLLSLGYNVLRSGMLGGLVAGGAVLSMAFVARSQPVGFHFIRPLWLLISIPSVLLFLRLRLRGDPLRRWRKAIPAHLLKHLVLGSPGGSKFGPLQLSILFSVVCTLAVAGPAWRHEPAPFGEDTATLVIVLEVTENMLAKDVSPSRLARAAQKIEDLVALRRGERTALVAYKGSAHLVMPATRDGDLIASFARELSPNVLPLAGDDPDRGLELAQSVLDEAGLAGSILWITSGSTPLTKAIETPVSTLLVTLDRSLQLQGAVSVTPDDADIVALARRIETVYRPAPAEAGGERWRDDGYWLMPLLLLMALIWFRPGWIVSRD